MKITQSSFQQAFAIILLLVLTQTVSAIQPFGANYTFINSTRATPDSAASIPALAGNVTEININGFSTTQSWQGYFGNVSGTIQLADGSDNQMYNWTLASPQGEIYATTSSSVQWSSIACFDLPGNHSALEAAFNISSDDVDGINETFSDTWDHDLFYTNNIEFSANECAATSLFDSSGASVDDHFEEVLLTDGTSAEQVIFTSLLDENVLGFDQRSHDFEMLVLEDGHGTDTSTTPYYFYVELE
jgi:hypothetical protein